MSTHSQARGAGSPLPFGAGLQAPAAQGSGQRSTRPPVQDRTASVAEGRGGPPAQEGVTLEDFLGADGGQPLDGGHAEALLGPLARGLSVAAAQGRLDGAMGPAAADSRFAPSAGELELAWRATEPVSAGAPSWSASAVAVGLGPAEPFAYLGARVLRALEAAPRVLMIGHPELPGVEDDLRAALMGAGVDEERLAAVGDADGSVLRDAAAKPSVAVDLVDFDPVEGLTLDRLRRLRALAAEGLAEGAAGRATASSQEPADGDWFGLGAVRRPVTPILARPRLARQLALGVEAAGVDAQLGEADLAEAAEQVVDEAFGRRALGGFASDAVTSVLVRPQLLSRFTACLLETLEEAEDDPWFAPPPWVRRTPRTLPLRDVAAGRRRILDEGATLIHERKLPKEITCGLVLTNVERRMKLAGEMSVPGTLFLVRALDPAGER
jgi:hypothetical protein